MRLSKSISQRVNPEFLRKARSVVVSANERLVLDLIRPQVEISRADLTRATDLTAQSVSRIVESLFERGFLKKGKAVANGRGQPSSPYKLNPKAAYTIGISIMTDAVSGSLMNFSGEVVDEVSESMTETSLEHVLSIIENITEDLAQKHIPNRSKLFGVGVGVTGYFIDTSKKVNPPPPLDELAFIDLDEIISERLSLPVWIDNDGNVAAMGEALAGAGSKYDTFAYIHFSKGIGGGMVIDRKMFRGTFGNAGEFAGTFHPDIHKERPTLESLRQLVNDSGIPLLDINDLIEKYDPNWIAIDDWVHRVKPMMEQLFSSINAIIDPEAIVLGGRMPTALAERLSHEIGFQNMTRRGTKRPMPIVIPSQVKGDATAIGAAAAPLKANFFI